MPSPIVIPIEETLDAVNFDYVIEEMRMLTDLNDEQIFDEISQSCELTEDEAQTLGRKLNVI